jgi:hypothetical protein
MSSMCNRVKRYVQLVDPGMGKKLCEQVLLFTCKNNLVQDVKHV